jgi:regulator of CtrA degradation
MRAQFAQQLLARPLLPVGRVTNRGWPRALTHLLLSPRVRLGNVIRSAERQAMDFADQDKSTSAGAMTFVQSEVFARTFREGMALVEETANYLDGEGRDCSKSLSRAGALSYAGASMRLTTQLMQIASWLLVLRAVREGDMSVGEASEDKYRLGSRERTPADLVSGELPKRLLALIEGAAQLYDRIARLDADLFKAVDDGRVRDAAAQQRALLDAFGRRG